MSATGGAGASGIGASMLSGAISSFGTGYMQSRAFKAQGSYQEGLANTNASMVDLATKQTLEAGDISASRKNLETQARVGSERAEQGASGVDVGSGSAALVRGGTNLAGNIDELTIRNNAARAAFGYKVQGIQDRFQGQFAQLTAKSQANQSLLSGGLGALSSILGIQSNYLRWSRYSGGNDSTKIPDNFLNNSNDASAGDQG